MRRLLLIAAMVAASIPARADLYDGNTLHKACTLNNEVADGLCRGYIFGVYDLLENQRLGTGRPYCIKNKVQGQQIVDVVKNHLAAHPEMRGYGAAFLVTESLFQAFCPNDPG
jgi:hypothetical protein